MGNKPVEISLEYCRRGKMVEAKSIEPEDYFDPVEGDETFEYDSVPKYLEQFEYSGEDFTALAWSRLTISDENKSISLISEERYWGENNCCRMLIVSMFRNGKKTSWEGTIEITCPETKDIQVVKIKEPTGECISGLVSHAIVNETNGNEKLIFVDIN